MLLDAYYDVQFSDRSHGFRSGRGCHTALSEVVDVWNGTHWFIEGDIARCLPPRPARQAGMGSPHGQAAPQNHRHLPPMPRGHPRGPPQRTHPELTTGEPCVAKVTSTVREETDGKGPHQRHLAGGRLHSVGGRRKRPRPRGDLAGGLPNRTAGSASGLEKRTNGNAGTALQADSTKVTGRSHRRPLVEAVESAANVVPRDRLPNGEGVGWRGRHGSLDSSPWPGSSGRTASPSARVSCSADGTW